MCPVRRSSLAGSAPLYFTERHPRIKTQLYCEENILSRLAHAQSHLKINEIKQILIDSFIRLILT